MMACILQWYGMHPYDTLFNWLFNWIFPYIFQMNPVTAFLQGDLEDVIYMKHPEYFSDNTNRVCLLRKSIYGLKQANRVWNI